MKSSNQAKATTQGPPPAKPRELRSMRKSDVPASKPPKAIETPADCPGKRKSRDVKKAQDSQPVTPVVK